MDAYEELKKLFERIDNEVCQIIDCEKCTIQGDLCRLYGNFEIELIKLGKNKIFK